MEKCTTVEGSFKLKCCVKCLLLGINVFQRAYNDAYAYGAIKVGLEYALKTGLFTGAFLYVTFFISYTAC